MNSGQAYVDSVLTVGGGMLNNTIEEELLGANYEGLLMTESPKGDVGDGALNSLEKSPKYRT